MPVFAFPFAFGLAEGRPPLAAEGATAGRSSHKGRVIHKKQTRMCSSTASQTRTQLNTTSAINLFIHPKRHIHRKILYNTRWKFHRGWLRLLARNGKQGNRNARSDTSGSSYMPREHIQQHHLQTKANLSNISPRPDRQYLPFHPRNLWQARPLSHWTSTG